MSLGDVNTTGMGSFFDIVLNLALIAIVIGLVIDFCIYVKACSEAIC